MSLQDSDLLYVERGGTLYQITWADVKSRSLLATDELLIQRGLIIYQVPVGDFWTCTEVSTSNDYYLVERNQTLYSEQIIFPCEVQIDISGATSTVVYISGGPDPVTGDSPYIQNADGTRTILTSTPTAYTLTTNGSYYIGGAISEFQIQSSDGTIDASPTAANVWANVFAGVPDFGKDLFTNISVLSGIPAGLALSSLDGTFAGTSPDTTNLGTLDTSAVTSAVGTFLNSQIDPSDDISTWDVSNVTNMSRMFEGASNFDVNISGWDIAAVTDLSSFLKGASIFNQDLSAWATPIIGVTNMASMFNGAQTFNQDLSTWDVSTLTDSTSMFEGAANFNQDLGDWDVEDVVAMDSMFQGASQFDQDLTEWCVRTHTVEPTDFSTGAPLTNVNKPVWGTCPAPLNGEILLISGTLRMSGTTSSAGVITYPDGTTKSIGPGNWSLSITSPGWYSLPQEDMTKLSFEDSSVCDFDFDPGFYTGNLTDMSSMFENCRVFNGDISNWDTSNVTNMFRVFENTWKFDGVISDWELGSVTDARRIFMNAKVFNQDISNWDVRSVTQGQNFFHNATLFNQDISSWNFENNLYFNEIFLNATSFNGDLSAWNVSNGRSFGKMFSNARAFTGGDLSSWDTTNITNMYEMFDNAIVFNGNTTTWDVSNTTNTARMFFNARAFNQDIGAWEVANVVNMTNMFQNAQAFNQTLNDWDVSGIPSSTQFANMFNNAQNMRGDLSEWCVANATFEPSRFDYNAGFENNTALLPSWGDCPIDEPTGLTITNFNGDPFYIYLGFGSGSRNIIQPDGTTLTVLANRTTELTQLGTYQLPMGSVTRMAFPGRLSTVSTSSNDVEFEFDPGFYTGAITNMYQMFRNAQGFNADISGWDTSQVTNMHSVFYNARAFNQDISSWDTSLNENFGDMFGLATAFNSDIGSWDTSSATNMANMFFYASSFNQDISSWDTSKVTYMRQMFFRATAFNQSLNPWDVNNVSNFSDMFNDASSMNGDISNWCVPQVVSKPTRFDQGAGFFGNDALQPEWGTCNSYNGIYLKELVGGVGDLVIGGVATDNTVQIRKPDGTLDNIGTGTFAQKYTQLGWYEVVNMDKLSGLRFFDNDILFDDTSETADFHFSSTIDTSGLTESRQMFREAMTFNGDISMLNLTNVTNMAGMFRNASAFSQDVTSFPTENVTNMANMFRGAISVNQDISGWSVYNVTDMTDMFRDATAFNSDISDWCVPLIASTPADFATGAGFDGNTAVQPGWGTCPNLVTVITEPVIANTNGTSPAPYGEDILIVTPAVTDPATGVIREGYKWQRSVDGLTGWTDIPASENSATSATFLPNGHDRNEYVRLVVSYGYPGNPSVDANSNAVQVENGDPTIAPLYTTSSFADTPEGQDFMINSKHYYFRTTLIGANNNFYSYASDNEWLLIWSAETGDIVEWKEMDFTQIEQDGSVGYIYWSGGIQVLGETKHLMAPGYLDHFWIYDYAADLWSILSGPNLGSGNQNYSGLCYSSVTGLYYSIPNTIRGDIYEVDPATMTYTLVYDNGITGYTQDSACEGPDGNIYMFPSSSATPKIVQFNPTTGGVVEIACPVAANTLWRSGNVQKAYNDCRYNAAQNAIYACPCQAMSFIKLDFNNMVGGVPTASEVVQTVDTNAAVNQRSKWHAMVEREDGKYSCLASGRIIDTDTGQILRNAVFDPATDTLTPDGDATLGQTTNQAWSCAQMNAPTGRAGSGLRMETSGTGGAGNQITQMALWDTYTPITTYDPTHPTYNRDF